jgi:hypothetical protein
MMPCSSRAVPMIFSLRNGQKAAARVLGQFALIARDGLRPNARDVLYCGIEAGGIARGSFTTASVCQHDVAANAR